MKKDELKLVQSNGLYSYKIGRWTSTPAKTKAEAKAEAEKNLVNIQDDLDCDVYFAQRWEFKNGIRDDLTAREILDLDS